MQWKIPGFFFAIRTSFKTFKHKLLFLWNSSFMKKICQVHVNYKNEQKMKTAVATLKTLICFDWHRIVTWKKMKAEINQQKLKLSFKSRKRRTMETLCFSLAIYFIYLRKYLIPNFCLDFINSSNQNFNFSDSIRRLNER